MRPLKPVHTSTQFNRLLSEMSRRLVRGWCIALNSYTIDIISFVNVVVLDLPGVDQIKLGGKHHMTGIKTAIGLAIS